MKVYEVEITRQIYQRGTVEVPAEDRDSAWDLVADDVENWSEAVEEWEDISSGGEFEVTNSRLAEPRD